MDMEFTSGDPETYPMQCSSLQNNGHVVLKGRPCKIVEMSTSNPGKHGDAKVHLVGRDLFTGERLEDIFASTDTMDVPNVKKTDYELLGISEDGFLSLMNGITDTFRDDLKNPDDDLGKEIKERFHTVEKNIMVIVLKAMGEECVIGSMIE